MPTVDTLLAKAYELLSEKKYRQLTSVCRQILEKEADNEFALHEMGRYNYYSGNYEKAEKYLEKASEKYVKQYQYMGPGQSDIIFDYGKCLLKLDELDKALSVYDEYLDNDDIQAQGLREDYYRNLAIICFYNRKADDAFKCLDYYLKHKPECQRLIDAKIDLLISCNRYDEAKRIYGEKHVTKIYQRRGNRFFTGIYDLDIIDSCVDDNTLNELAKSLNLSLNINNLIDRWYIYSYAYALTNELDEKMAQSFANIITLIFSNCRISSKTSEYYDEEKIFRRIHEVHGRYNETGNEKDKAKPLFNDVLHIYKDNFEEYSKQTKEVKLEISDGIYEKFKNVPGYDDMEKFRNLLRDYYENRKNIGYDESSEYCKHLNYKFREQMTWKRLYTKEGSKLLYEGFTLNNKPCGLGTEYDKNGNRYREGIFDIKGLVQGKEYYSNGQIRFEGTYHIHDRYGPNYPIRGNYYSEDGKLLFSGKFKVTKSNIGIPKVLIPRNYVINLHDPSEVKYMSWNDVKNIE